MLKAYNTDNIVIKANEWSSQGKPQIHCMGFLPSGKPCNQTLIAKSYKRTNKKAPYFAHFPGQGNDCDQGMGFYGLAPRFLGKEGDNSCDTWYKNDGNNPLELILPGKSPCKTRNQTVSRTGENTNRNTRVSYGGPSGEPSGTVPIGQLELLKRQLHLPAPDETVIHQGRICPIIKVNGKNKSKEEFKQNELAFFYGKVNAVGPSGYNNLFIRFENSDLSIMLRKIEQERASNQDSFRKLKGRVCAIFGIPLKNKGRYGWRVIPYLEPSEIHFTALPVGIDFEYSS